MSFADQAFHNKWVLIEIFTHSTNNRYCYFTNGNFAAKKGLLKLIQLKKMCSDRLYFTVAAMDWAARDGHLETVKWLHANRTEGCTDSAMDLAAMNGLLHIIQWLHANRSELCSRQRSWQGCTVNAMNHALVNGHLETVQWLRANRREGFTRFVMDWAIENGHLEIVQWLTLQKNDCDKS